jgi:hypothetical protein
MRVIAGQIEGGLASAGRSRRSRPRGPSARAFRIGVQQRGVEPLTTAAGPGPTGCGELGRTEGEEWRLWRRRGPARPA